MHVITDATVIPMDRERALAHHDVLVDDGRILDVVPTGGALPDGCTQIDGAGRFLIPGLIDAHVHFLRGETLVNDALQELYLINGSTSVLCLDGFDEVLERQQAVAAGERFGPTIFSSGPIHNEAELDYDGGRAAAISEAATGYTFVKVYNDLTVEGYGGLVDGAREAGIRVLGHVPRAPGLGGVFASGQVSIVHAEEFLYTHFGYSVGAKTDWRAGGTTSLAALPALCARVAELGIVVGPTVRCFFSIWQQSQDIAAWTRAEQLDYLPAHLVARWQAPTNRYVDLFKADHCRRNLAEGYWFQLRLIEELHAAGVPLTAGTDTTVHNVLPDFIHAEIAELAIAGLGSWEALKAATVNAAQLIEPGTTRGTIQKGAPADLLLLGADPLADVRATSDIHGVMARGEWHDRTALDARLAALKAARAEQDAESAVRVAA